MLKQAIDLPGIENARELGGYAVGGKMIKKGVLLTRRCFTGNYR